MVSTADLNPFGKFNIGLGTIGNALILIVLIIVVFGLVGWIIYWRITSKQFNKKIPLFKSINGTNFKQANYVAKNVTISKAGDSLWFVKGIKKFLAPATLTSGPNEYPHEEREDGEWINFSIDSVNDAQKKAGVKFIQQDMRTQRVATGQILEQRLVNKGFWEKYKDQIISLIFYLVTAMLMIVIFWQWTNVVEMMGGLIDKLVLVGEKLDQLECIGIREVGIVPALSFLMFRRRK